MECFHGFNSLWPSDLIWRHRRSGSMLAQVMACCLVAPSHYLHQWWVTIINSRLITWTFKMSIPKLFLQFTHSKYEPHLPRDNELNLINILRCDSSTTGSSVILELAITGLYCSLHDGRLCNFHLFVLHMYVNIIIVKLYTHVTIR